MNQIIIKIGLRIRNYYYSFELLMMQEKTFFLENEETNKSELVPWRIPKTGSIVDLKELLKRVPNMNTKIFKIYDAEKDDYIKFFKLSSSKNPYQVPRTLLVLPMIIIKYNENPELQDDEEYCKSEDSNKKQRSRERTIRQVIELIERWRTYHEYSADGRRRTLQESAAFVGVSKKSLDDYYYQLRVGEKHDFDFTSHLEDKIGVLRAFIKQKEPSRKAEGRNSKHPKTLRIIQQFSEKLRITEASQNQQTPVPVQVSVKIENEIESKIETPYCLAQEPSNEFHDPFESLGGEQQIFWGSPFTPVSQQKYVNCEKKFYDSFGLNFEEPEDPYLNLSLFMSKKSYNSDDEII